jgi:uncharacterized protein (TIGR03437 family)
MRMLVATGIALAQLILAQEIQTVPVTSGINAPTDIQNAGDGSGRLFLVQQDGIVRILRDGALAPQPFLDITGKTRAGGERGLLGLAFPPGFAQVRRFYVNYTDLNGDTVIAQYRVSANPDAADAASEIVLLRIPQPFANHNGGQMRFGPDGYLYIGMGDGGSGGDPLNNGQSLGTLLGKLLRLDVESDPGSVRIPPDNPFANTAGARAEIWAYGLRNPWRFSFDRATGDLWIADVGQSAYEEVDFQPALSHGGENYGWNRMEGAHCFAAGCSMQDLALPVAEYSHAEGCSVTGGFVYRGRASPGLRGKFLYGDYCSGRIWGVERQGTQWVNRLLLSSGFLISTFGEDEAGEIYVANAADGSIHRITGSLAPSFMAATVVNPASYLPGMTAGSFAAVFAAGVLDDPGMVVADRIPLPASLNGVSVTVDGLPAPILALANVHGVEQVNFQAPFEIAGRVAASVTVARNGAASSAAGVPVLELQPAVYTSDGVRAIVVHAADYTLVTEERPLAAGEFGFVYATGLGPVANQPATGSGGPVSPLATVLAAPRVSLAGLSCDVPFAGLAPTLVGVYQVNFRVPPGAPTGLQDLVLSAGGASAPAVKAPVR